MSLFNLSGFQMLLLFSSTMCLHPECEHSKSCRQIIKKIGWHTAIYQMYKCNFKFLIKSNSPILWQLATTASNRCHFSQLNFQVHSAACRVPQISSLLLLLLLERRKGEKKRRILSLFMCNVWQYKQINSSMLPNTHSSRLHVP